MTSSEIRKTFLEFFASKSHTLVKAAPIVIKGDPSLMFTNAGMNQFKELFLGNQAVRDPRAADSQPCLRVSGKHNDLEDVGRDTYHHTLFEMLGNWSFGDYFKKEAIEWAWELLTDVYKLPKDRLYVTVFGGDADDNLDWDEEAFSIWKPLIGEDRILKCSKKDNFWEMGDTGPCGPCSEIHIDLRSEEEIQQIPGKQLVNESHPQVVEIWNLVFMQFNRMANRSLQPLPAKHVDTGMGFERLTMALQGKRSNYDTDIFMPIISAIETRSGFTYGQKEETDIAIRVIADHIRAITFIIADGQMPSNAKAGYVCRRILRRALRYGYSFLNINTPFLFELVDVLALQFKDFFPQIVAQQAFIKRIIQEEEVAFLRTLANGLKRIEQVQAELKAKGEKEISGETAFELYDTYGFPLDLTLLVVSDQEMSVDEEGFKTAMAAQKARSRADAATEAGDWVYVSDEETEVRFIGYDSMECEAEVLRYRTVNIKGKPVYQVVLNVSPFYAESGGQVGDTGLLISDNQRLTVLDTRKENNLILHVVDALPTETAYKAVVNRSRRNLTSANHSATHLLHAALRQVLGTHVEQKGSLVNPEGLRFDFAHFSKMTDEELAEVEKIVNQRIQMNIALQEERAVPIEEARSRGAIALFGEKYGDTVRVITFDPNYSVELCGGTHVPNTADIGFFKLRSEASISAGIRRIEALSSEGALNYLLEQEKELSKVRDLLKNPKSVTQAVEKLQQELSSAQHLAEQLEAKWTKSLMTDLQSKWIATDNQTYIAEIVDVVSADALKKLCIDLRNTSANALVFLVANVQGKPALALACSDEVVEKSGYNAAQVIRELAKFVQGGGGGQAFLATAGGQNPDGIQSALDAFVKMIESK